MAIYIKVLWDHYFVEGETVTVATKLGILANLSRFSSKKIGERGGMEWNKKQNNQPNTSIM